MRRGARAALGAAIGAVVLAALAGCGSEDGDGGDGDGDGMPAFTEGGEPADPPPAAPRPDVDFEAEVEVVDGEVRAQYTVTNNTGQAVFLPNRVPVPSGGGVHHANLPYVTGADDGVVVLSQRAFPWPDPTVTRAVPPRGAGTMLPAGEAVTVALGAPAPLERRHPFGDDLGHGTIALPDPVTGVRLCVGVVAPPFPPAMGLDRVQRGTTPAEDVYEFAHGNAAHDAQHLFCSDTVPYDG